MKTLSDKKRQLENRGAPCGYYKVDEESGKLERYYPSVDCSYDCDSCGWNPKECERRWEQGEVVKTYIRKNAETREIIEIPKGVNTLVFQKKENANV